MPAVAFQYQPSVTVPELINNIEQFAAQNETFDGASLMPLTLYPNETVRVQAVKALGKLKSIEFLDTFIRIAEQDRSTLVKREAVSSIGRMRTPETIDKLISMLQQPDPKVVCQAIRGLLVFKGEPKVDEALKSLRNHPNEMVSSIINKEYFTKKKVV